MKIAIQIAGSNFSTWDREDYCLHEVKSIDDANRIARAFSNQLETMVRMVIIPEDLRNQFIYKSDVCNLNGIYFNPINKTYYCI